MRDDIEDPMAGLGEALADAPEDVRDFVRNLAPFLREHGIDGLQERILGWDGSPENSPFRGVEERRSGRSGRPTGSGGFTKHQAINVIPAQPSAPPKCCPWVLAVATHVKRGGGVWKVLRLLREHLIHCGTGPKGLRDRTAILITDSWSTYSAEESRLDIRAHQNISGLRFVALHWDGKKWRREKV